MQFRSCTSSTQEVPASERAATASSGPFIVRRYEASDRRSKPFSSRPGGVRITGRAYVKGSSGGLGRTEKAPGGRPVAHSAMAALASARGLGAP